MPADSQRAVLLIVLDFAPKVFSFFFKSQSMSKSSSPSTVENYFELLNLKKGGGKKPKQQQKPGGTDLYVSLQKKYVNALQIRGPKIGGRFSSTGDRLAVNILGHFTLHILWYATMRASSWRGGYKQDRRCTQPIFVSVSEDQEEPMTIYRIVFRTLWGKNYQKARKPLLDDTKRQILH